VKEGEVWVSKNGAAYSVVKVEDFGGGRGLVKYTRLHKNPFPNQKEYSEYFSEFCDTFSFFCADRSEWNFEEEEL